MHFHSVLIDGVPRLAPEERNEARRFLTLVEALYEHRVHLICAAADQPDRLYPAGDGALEFPPRRPRASSRCSRPTISLLPICR